LILASKWCEVVMLYSPKQSICSTPLAEQRPRPYAKFPIPKVGATPLGRWWPRVAPLTQRRHEPLPLLWPFCRVGLRQSSHEGHSHHVRRRPRFPPTSCFNRTSIRALVRVRATAAILACARPLHSIRGRRNAAPIGSERKACTCVHAFLRCQELRHECRCDEEHRVALRVDRPSRQRMQHIRAVACRSPPI
jgi:hypothetical protein